MISARFEFASSSAASADISCSKCRSRCPYLSFRTWAENTRPRNSSNSKVKGRMGSWPWGSCGPGRNSPVPSRTPAGLPRPALIISARFLSNPVVNGWSNAAPKVRPRLTGNVEAVAPRTNSLSTSERVRGKLVIAVPSREHHQVL